jgi:hypothetical protein
MRSSRPFGITAVIIPNGRLRCLAGPLFARAGRRQEDCTGTSSRSISWRLRPLVSGTLRQK